MGQHFLPVSALGEGQFSALNEFREQPQNWAEVVVPTKLLPGSKLPAVIYLHGCAGNRNGMYWWQQLKKTRFIFFCTGQHGTPSTVALRHRKH